MSRLSGAAFIAILPESRDSRTALVSITGLVLFSIYIFIYLLFY